MKRFIHTLDRILSPILILGYAALCIILLAVVPGGRVGLLFSILWAVASMAGLRWGVWGILQLARTKADAGELKVLVRTVEALMLILTVAAAIFAILLWDIPSVWLFLPVPLFGLAGAVRVDANSL